MELSDIFALLERFESSSIQRMELRMEDFRLELDKNAAVTVAPVAAAPVAAAPVAAPSAAPAPAAAPKAEAPAGPTINAPLVGTFYSAPSPDAAPFVSVGDTVKKGQTVCILEAMKMMSEVPSPADGVVEEILVRDGELVGYDQPLFRLREV
ncbi:MAG TPA: acetyl-CoA carboxylase biotin carboxyl carrier protein [Candidatus Flavonifractor merdipullorum]|uniref:Biotin carboxyl carrier protein of acetyl-CoA carboxylase n=1 Tax=Candidatus Flavonifractor merdipullorum TaxID=2838590 RepID=A0A9D1RV52_9FIRM|nr:acetyl-CoA carboxylase biotin carboxyl carrier protein [Candidatus Flavonifractor merdipullorum]